MKFSDLKNIKIDINALKNLSLKDIRNFVNENQVLSLNIAIAGATIFLMVFVVQARIGEYVKLKSELDEISGKEATVRQYEKVIKEARDFWKAVPGGVPDEQMISFITQAATRRNITISTFDPPRSSAAGFYNEVTVDLVCTARGFKDLLLFVNDLESSQYLVKVNSLSFKEQGSRGAKGQSSAGDPMLALEINVSSVELMRNAKKEPQE